MLQIRTTIDNRLQYLDLFEDSNITLDVSFLEVQDITKKNSPYSQTFKLPGSKNNNNIFNAFYDFNSSPVDYSPLQKFNAEIAFNGVVLYAGYIRLNSATRIVNEIVYDVTFYSEVGDLISNMKDKFLSDLVLSDTPSDFQVTGYPFNLQFQYSQDWDPDLNPALYNSPDPLKNGNVYFSILNRGLSYIQDVTSGGQTVDAEIIPRMAWQKPTFFSDENTYWDSTEYIVPYIPFKAISTVPRTYMTGSLRVKDIYESIFRNAGYSVSSNFFDTAYFKRIYMPLTVSNNNYYPVQSVQPTFSFESVGATTATSVNFICPNYTWTELPSLVTHESNRINISGYSVDNTSFYQYPDSFFLTQQGLYRFQISFDAVSNVDASFTFDIRNIYNPGTGGTPYYSCWDVGYTVSSTDPINIESGQQLINQVVIVEVNTRDLNVSGGTYFGLDWRNLNPVDDVRLTKVSMSIVTAPNFIPIASGATSATYNPLLEFVKPDVKQIDFISGINKLFNLVVIPNPDKQKEIIVEPVIDWIGKGDVLDWSGKVNREAPITIQPLTTIINGTLNFDYTDDGSSSNLNFKTLNERKFGQNIQTLNTDYRDSVLQFGNIFSAQSDSTLNTESSYKGFTIPNYFSSKTVDKEGTTFVEFNPYKTTPKLLFRSPNLPIKSLRQGNTNWINIDGTFSTEWSNNNRRTTYPFGVSGLTHAVVWNKRDKTDIDELDFIEYEDLYEIYYKDYVEDMVDVTNRIVGCEMYFEPYELSSLKWNEKIFLDGNYYRVNKIKGFNLVEPGLTKVELIKLTREYQGHRVRYYDLENCSGATDLHTSTDLNYGVYYLKGYNVKISGECYTISAGTYNSGYTYQALDLSDSYIDCDCLVTTQQTGIGFYNELVPIIPPTPTPLPPSNCSEDCQEIEWENESPLWMAVTYKECITGDIVTVSVYPSQIWRDCVCLDFQPQYAGAGSLVINYQGVCNTVTPTPTPTLVTATPTPTPTPTPGACYEYELENQNPYLVTYYYTDCCTGLLDNGTISADNIVIVCSNTVPTGTGFVINNIDFCPLPCPSPTPTPVTATPTPTPTNTPSSGSYTYYYNTEKCDVPGDFINFGSNTFYPTGKVVKGGIVTGCYEIIAQYVSPVPVADSIALAYNSCGVCP